MCAVAEELGGADVERDERGDDAERAPSLRERDAVGGGELPCKSERHRVSTTGQREAEKRGWRTCTEQREGDGEEEEEDDEADVPPQRRDPKNTQATVSATARDERCSCGRYPGLIVASAS